MGTTSRTAMKTDRFDHCLICNSKDLSPLGGEYARAFLVRCSSCGFVFCERIPSSEELSAHYKGYPRDTVISPLTIKRYNELLDRMEAFRKTNSLLDIGCGDGHFLIVAKERGWNVSGTEFTDDAVSICKAKGINMHQGPLSTCTFTETFDVITSFEVIEHINDPLDEARKINSLLRKGGLFYFTTPNFNALSRRRLGGKWNMIEYPEHLCYFTPRTITRLLRENGFAKMSVLTSGFSLSRWQASRGNGDNERSADEVLRTKIERNLFLKMAKSTVNFFLRSFGAGDSLKGFFTKV